MLVLGASLTIIGSGVTYTLDAGSTSYEWIGYQIITGIGIGTAFQVPILVNLVSVKNEDISTMTAITLFSQTIGGAFYTMMAELALISTLLEEIAVKSPSLDLATVIQAQPAALRDTFTGETLANVLAAYQTGLRGAVVWGMIAGGIATVLAVCPQWRKVKGN
ncbi:hypothetical protein FQN49_007798 [Arthroderma sp. PD_2]|nr:hypothetical protein FQN49_007798 [Arthroderma sp. PD_2]